MIVATSQSIVQWVVMGLRDAVSVGAKIYPNKVIVSLSIKLPYTDSSKAFLAQKLMDVLNQQMNLCVHQICLREVWDLGRAKLEHTLHTSIPGIHPTSRNDSTAWKGRNTLSGSTLPS